MKPYDPKTHSRRVNGNTAKSSDLVIPGNVYKAATDKGRLVDVWVPEDEVAKNNRYFCHGWSLGTYQAFGYTVSSGEDVGKVLADEYTQVTASGSGKQRFSNALPDEEAADLSACLARTKAGSVVAWEDAKGLILHSARIEDFVEVDGVRLASHTLMSTKNGLLEALAMGRLPEVCTTYKHLTHFRVWNAGAPPPNTMCVIL